MNSNTPETSKTRGIKYSQPKEHYGLKDYFLTGVIAILPLTLSLWLTAWIAVIAWQKLLSVLVPEVDTLLRQFCSPDSVQMLEAWHVHQIAGLLLLLLFILVVGFVARRYIGITLLRLLDRLIAAIPGLNFIYGTIRQFTATIDPHSPQHDAFRHAVLVRVHGILVLGFLTSHSKADGKPCATVFIPTNQLIQGYSILVPEKDVLALDIKVDDALKYVISFGMMAPGLFKASASAKALRPKKQ